jgi:hypothetical protein
MAITDPLAIYLQNHPISQDEREAVILLMLVIMYADKRLTLDENATLRAYEKVIRWEADTSLSDFFTNRIFEIRSAMRDESKLSELLKTTCARIQQQEIKTLTMQACHDMAAADHLNDANERQLIAAIILNLQR